MQSTTVIVVGSIVVDIPVWLPRSPVNGETLKVESHGFFAGGKGLNQAVQIQRLGGQPLLVGQIGQDILGQWMLKEIASEGLMVDAISQNAHVATSYAIPVIESLEQHILHVPGANLALQVSDVQASQTFWGQAKVLLVQGEVTPDASVVAMQRMKACHGLVICDPAPTEGITERMLQNADVLTPNLSELSTLSGIPLHENSPWATIKQAVRTVLVQYPRTQLVLATAGSSGVYYCPRHDSWEHFLPPVVSAVDPTAAGDSFNGAWAWAVSQGASWRDACKPALVAGSLTASKHGALPSLPHRFEFDRLELTFRLNSSV